MLHGYAEVQEDKLRMNKLRLLKAVNALLIVAFIVQAATSLIMYFRVNVPDMKPILEIHEHVGLLLIALVALHFTLNWGWIRANFFRRGK
jgi:hypothetical protein